MSSINPMNREHELELLLRDSGASVLPAGLHRDVAASVVAGSSTRSRRR